MNDASHRPTAQRPALSRSVLPWYPGWTVLVAMMAVQAFGYGIYASFTFWVNPWMATFDVSRSQIMLAMMTTNLGMALLAPFIGKAMGRIPIKRLVAAGMSIYVVAMLLLSVTTSIIQIIAIYALLVSLSLTLAGTLAAQTLMVNWFSRRRGLALGLVSVGSSIGAFLLPPIVAYLIVTIGWRASHLVIAATALVVFIPLILMFIRAPESSTGESKQLVETIDSDAQGVADGGYDYPEWTTTSVLRSRNFFPLVICFLPLALSVIIFSANFGPYSSDLGIAPQTGSFLLSFFALTMIIGKLVVSLLCDYLDFRLIYAGVVLLLMGGLGVLTTTPSYLELMAASVMIGFSAGSFVTIMAAIVGRQFGPRGFGLVIGMMFFANSWTAIAVPLSAWVRDTTGSYLGVWWALLAIAAGCALLMLIIRPVPRMVQG